MSARPNSRVAPAVTRIADRLARPRHQRFVGRAAELTLFRTALDAVEPTFVVLHVHGPGGIGKTTLMQQFGRMAQAAGRAVIRLDMRDIEPAPEVFRVALSQVMGLEPCSAHEIAEHGPNDGVLLIDTYESVAALDDWLRDDFVPQLP